MSSYLIIIEGDGSTNYSAYCPDLPGVVATGDSIDECSAEMRDAIAFHIEGLREAGEPRASVYQQRAHGGRRCLKRSNGEPHDGLRIVGLAARGWRSPILR